MRTWVMDLVRDGFTETRPRLRYWQAGARGPRLLLVMGFSMRGDVWRPQVDDLSRDHQVAFFDNRGVGESERSGRFWTMGDMAEDTLRVADALGWDDFHLTGVSMGGMVAQELACRAPERVRGLTLIATHEGGRFADWLPTMHALKVFWRANTGPRSQRLEALREMLYPPAFLATVDPEVLSERMRLQMGRPTDRETLLGQMSAIVRHATGSRLPAFQKPTLVIKPVDDILVPPRASDRLRKRLPHARLLELDGAGHGAVFQKAAEINQAIREQVAIADRALDDEPVRVADSRHDASNGSSDATR